MMKRKYRGIKKAHHCTNPELSSENDLGVDIHAGRT